MGNTFKDKEKFDKFAKRELSEQFFKRYKQKIKKSNKEYSRKREKRHNKNNVDGDLLIDAEYEKE